jgi:hypothetical protein
MAAGRRVPEGVTPGAGPGLPGIRPPGPSRLRRLSRASPGYESARSPAIIQAPQATLPGTIGQRGEPRARRHHIRRPTLPEPRQRSSTASSRRGGGTGIGGIWRGGNTGGTGPSRNSRRGAGLLS